VRGGNIVNIGKEQEATVLSSLNRPKRIEQETPKKETPAVEREEVKAGA
jgi:hypothetical protein